MAAYCRFGKEKEFELRDEEYFKKLRKSQGRFLPKNERALRWMSSEENRGLLSETIASVRRALRMKPVQSNYEMLERLEEYLSIVQDRRVPPTLEELSLYLGFTLQMVLEIRDGTNLGFPDQPYPGATSAKILERVIDALHSVDAVQAMKRQADNTTYIFRSKNYYGMKDTREQAINVNLRTPDVLPPEQIAKLLPELAPDRSPNGVTITTDDEI